MLCNCKDAHTYIAYVGRNDLITLITEQKGKNLPKH